ncbi:MAG: ATP-dependent DNA helicase [Bifidobacteriaceae bacterium]|jgi:ATP-dependent DNA helicase DinG|nr:ATP-dependent DNA helicase [Bifidobacteriaceae bacterium]
MDRAVASIGGHPRPGQLAMADAVAAAIADRRHLLVQAGTGTGKSLGYLIPALRHVRSHGGSVIVATATLALQRQLMAADLPVAVDAVGGSLHTAVLKGRTNYACLHKLAGGYAEVPMLFEVDDAGAGHGGASSPLETQMARIRRWADQTETGDVDDLRPGPSPRAWRLASVSARECLGARCPLVEECFAERAKSNAERADLVVTNHTLLALHMATDRAVLPEFDMVIIDEAHELADRITSALTVTLAGTSAERAVRATAQAGFDADTLAATAEPLRQRLDAIGERRLAGGPPEDLAAAVSAVREGAREAVRGLDAITRASDTAAAKTSDGVRQFAQARLVELIEVTDAIGGCGSADVLWTAPTADDDAQDLHLAPLSVAGMIRGTVFGDKPAILTSATLSLGDDFAAIAHACGLDPERRETGDSADLGAETADDDAVGEPDGTEEMTPVWRGLDVGSPFDYRAQGIAYVASHIPPPTREGTPDEQIDVMERLIGAAGGGTLGLFTSRARAERAAGALRERLDVPILVQGSETLSVLVDRFRDEPDTCLLGTFSLWQGVDAPGATCRLVIIDRIPFPRPDDPIRSARSEAIDQAGGSGFMAVSVAAAALMLAQGAGRLIRGTNDRGVVAILDPRLITKRYGVALRRALPPLWPTTDLELTCGALERLRRR